MGYSIIPESSLSLLARSDIGKTLTNKYEKTIKEEFDAIWNDLKTHLLSEKGTAKGQALLEIFPRVLRMRLLSTHLKGEKKGRTTLKELFAVDLKSIMCTVEGRPFHAATTTSRKNSLLQDGARRSGWKIPSSLTKVIHLEEILNRPILLSDVKEPLLIASSMYAGKQTLRQLILV